MDLTVLELHFPNAEFNAPYANTTSESTDDTPTQSTDDQADSGFFPLLFLLIVAGIAIIAYLIRRTATAE